jgi:SAM-dependent methyltransferase
VSAARDARPAVDQALLETQRAFDGVAATYARSNAENLLLCEMRRRALATLERSVPRGSHVLDLGCGPGGDDEYLAARGYRVTALDWSAAMVDEARRRVRAAPSLVRGRVAVHHLGIQELDRLAPAVYDAAYSNFGPINCVPDAVAAARLVASRLKPGGVLVASVIGRVCPWEIALYASRGHWARALVRFSRDPVPVPLEGRTVWTRYYTPGRFEEAFACAGFSRVSLRALGLLVPPPYLHTFAGGHPRLVSGLQRLEDLVADWPGLRACGDHFLIVLRRA